MESVLYFGYGANREPRMMAAITGNPNLVGHSILIKGLKLCVQRFDQVPDTSQGTLPYPRKVLQDAGWDPNTFESYIVKPDKEGQVFGMLWELTPQERELVRDWELIDFGWYKDMRLKIDVGEGGIFVVDENGRFPIQTEGLREEQEVDREVNGLHYESWLQPSEDFERVAEKSRREYFERLAEGKITSREIK